MTPSSAPLERPGWPARLSNRLAMHFPVAPFNASRGEALVTFTFDDTPVSAVTTGAALIEAHDARATYYIASGLLGTRAEGWDVIGPETVGELHRRGHEIGCHSHTHARADFLTADELEADVRHNHEILKGIDPTLRIENFAYPYGYGSIAWKLRLKTLFNSSRTVSPRVNRGVTDRHYLGSIPLISAQIDRQGIDRVLDETARSAGWTIFYTHDVTDRPSQYGCTPDLLDYALAATKRHGMAIATVARALAMKVSTPLIAAICLI